jgi:hypothetical protein
MIGNFTESYFSGKLFAGAASPFLLGQLGA